MMDRLARRLIPARPGAASLALAGTPEDTLEAFDVTVHFEGLAAVDGVSISMRNGEVFGLIGPNGAGKTTLVNAMTGFQRPTRGRVVLGGEDVTGLSAHELGRRGLARTFQAVRLFRDMPVIENLEAAAVGTGLGRREAARRASRILAWMRFAHRADDWADTLPYGDERRVGIGRALAMAPRFVLLDEPAAGLSDAECDELMGLIAEIPRGLRLRGVADRAQHAGHHGGLPPHPRDRERAHRGRGFAGGDPGEPRRAARLPGDQVG